MKKSSHTSAQYHLGAAAAPLLILLTGTLVPLLWRADIIAPIPLHWGTNGPDRFGTLTDLLWPMLVIGIPLLVFMWALGGKIGKDLMTQRIMVVTNNFLAGLFVATTVTTAYQARGVVDTSNLQMSSLGLAAGMVGGLIIGGIFAALLPNMPTSVAATHPSDTAPRAQLSDTENAVWVRRETSLPSLIVGILSLVLLVWTSIAAEIWAMLILPAVLSVLLVTMFVWDLRVDSRGFLCRSVLRVFSKRYKLSEILEANVVDTRALRDFGGWGWRTALDGATGIILRSGESLELKLTDNRIFVVTTKDAHTAAGLVNSLIERER